MEILPGDVLFIWGNDFFDKAIEEITQGPSHCALFLNSETLAEAAPGKTIGEIPLSDYFSSGEKIEVWQDKSLTEEERNRIVMFAKSLYGFSYDYLAILAELARFELKIPIRSFHEGKRRICSSYVFDCAKSIGKDWSNISPPAPVDLLNSGKLAKKGAL